MGKRSAAMGQKSCRSRHQLRPVYAAVLLAFAAETAQSNPMDATVVAGQASFATTGNTLTVVNTPGTIINWGSFSIGSSEITSFVQQSASSTVLNRVIGSDPSNILGTLQSNGRVFLINPNGILFGQGSTVDVAGLVASTLNLSDADFLAGRLNFTEVPGAQNLSNAGSLTAQDGGHIYLIAPNVQTSGVITAPNGEILLAAGSSVELLNSNDPNLRVSITAPAGDVTNVGQLVAEAGSLGLFGTVVKNTGTVSADSATMQGGRIVFRASQRVEAGGTISASGVGGGEIKLLADMQIGTVDVTGTLEASAPVGGDGGFIETSASNVHVADTASVSTLAQSGSNGTWLIDPTDFYISAVNPANGSSWMSNTTLTSSLAAGNVLIQTLAIGASPGDIYVNDAVSWSTNTLTLSAHNNILINANLNGDLLGTGPAKLVLEFGQGALAAGNTSSYKIANGAKVNLLAGQNFTTRQGSDGTAIGYTVITSLGAAGDQGTGVLTLQGLAATANLAGNYVLGTDIDASATSGWNPDGLGGFFGFAPIGASITTPFIGQFDGLGHTVNNLFINRTGTANVGLFGWLGTNSAVSNLGLVGGSITGWYGVGSLAGYSAAKLDSVYANGVSVAESGWSTIGGLVGKAGFGGSITNCYVDNGTVTGYGRWIGGMAGYSEVNITNSHVSNTVVNGGVTADSIGGLAGWNTTGVITNSYVSGGSVSGQINVGGLIGKNSGFIIGGSYASNVSVSGTGWYAGGLVGWNQNVILDSHASGVTVSGNSSVGGLVGYNTGSVTNSYVSSGSISGITSVGSLLGTSPGVVSNSHYNISGVTNNGAHMVSRGGLYNDVLNTQGKGQFDAWVTGGMTLNITDYSATLVDTLTTLPIPNTSVEIYRISTIDGMKNLLGFAENPAYAFKLGANINLAALPGYYVPFLATSFDGANFTISNLNLDQYDRLGMFGRIGIDGSVSNLKLTNAKVTGTNAVGALAGWNDGNIVNCSSTNGDISGWSEVGGLVGHNEGSFSFTNFSALVTRGNISGSFVSGGKVSGQQGDVGGLVGRGVGGWSSSSNIYFGTINNSYVTSGTVVSASSGGSSNTGVGGLVGSTDGGSIVNSYVNNGVVSGVDNVGGLVGLNGDWSGAMLIDSCHVSGGSVTGTNNVGGLVGHNGSFWGGGNNNLIVNSYVSNGNVNGAWNVGGLVGHDSGEGSLMHIDTSHVINTIVAGSTNVGGLVGNNGGNNWSVAFITNSYVSNGNVSGASHVGGLVGYNGHATGSFSGTVVSGLAGAAIASSFVDTGTVVSGSSSVGGLVGYNRGLVVNSYVSGGSVKGPVLNQGSRIGGLVGYNATGNANASSSFSSFTGGAISGSYVTGGTVVNGWSDIGGLVGQSDGMIDASHVSGAKVSGTYAVGGLLGRSGVGSGSVSGPSGTFANFTGGNVFNSYVDGGTVVTASMFEAGGLVGYNNGTISDSHVSGANVSGGIGVGGLVGLNSSGTRSGSGSFVSFSGGNIARSYVDAGTVVSGASEVGGLAGTNWGWVSGSYVMNSSVNASGTTGTGFGGLVGMNTHTIFGSFVSGGSVSGVDNVGGLVGLNEAGAGGAGAGSIAGTAGSAAMVSNSYVSGGSVSGTTNVGGLVGSNIGGDGGAGAFASFSVPMAGAGGAGGVATISNSYISGGTVSGTTNVGILVGKNASGATGAAGGGGFGGAGGAGGVAGVTNTFWNSDTSGALAAVGLDTGILNNAIGMMTAQMMSIASFSSWNSVAPTIANTGGAGTVWRIYEGNTMPLLSSFLQPLDIDPANGYTKVYDAQPFFTINASYTDGAGGAVVPDPTLLFGSLYNGAVNAGTYSLSTAGMYSSQLGYDLLNVSTASLTITPATLTIVADSISKVYGMPVDPLLTYTVYGLQGVDTAAATVSGGLIRDPGEMVGAYQINEDPLNMFTVIDPNNNYVLKYSGPVPAYFTPGTFTIVPPSVIGEIVEISTQDSTDTEKKAEDIVVAEAPTQTESTEVQSLPVCN